MSDKQVAIFAGGCFWCMVHPFDQWDGVESVRSGYTGGHVENPTYEQVCTGKTGHTEAVKIVYDPEKISYQTMLDIYWSSMDPTDADGQFGDRGSSYRPVIFYTTEEQKAQAQASKEALDQSGRYQKPIVVPIELAQPFYEAEEYHQNFYQKNRAHYQRYSVGSGRVDFIERHKVD
ncbi:peptide-methionine (S)-S-oxide reductase MsrA [Eremococcus coleocola]|uniref:peptide-methionine (S)-S-oxide reductase MsrA n=1 Tax=Eremococcus coleocola TaxID=88132 RepID=UPI000400FBCF|nr:peptide-methionine (S)-S-oxide reductase MsrA [Eremococcus coleocola]